jgi:hypothetical protein
MADDEVKEIFDGHDAKYGAVIEMLSEVVKMIEFKTATVSC